MTSAGDAAARGAPAHAALVGATIRIPIPGPLAEASFLQRPNRFLLLCRLRHTGEVVAAHLADPGRLKEILLPGVRIWLRREPPGRGARSTAWSALLVEAADGLVSLHTTLPNRLVRVAIEARALQELDGWELERAEVPLGRSRIDFLLRRGDERLALEVKSVSLVEGGLALFPDAVTARGARHVRELTLLAGRPGWAAGILFVVQRANPQGVRAAASIDPTFAAALTAARAAGVHILARRCRVSLEALELGEAIPCE